MDQQAINAREWDDRENWSRKGWLGVYFSKRDSRIWVRKPVPALGWTVNFAQPGGAAIVVTVIFAALLVASLASILARS